MSRPPLPLKSGAEHRARAVQCLNLAMTLAVLEGLDPGGAEQHRKDRERLAEESIDEMLCALEVRLQELKR